jgi:rhodanese-related sulfurtransferase
MWWVIIGFIVFMMLFKMFMLSNISIENAADKLKNGAVLVDVRTPGEFSSGAHPEAVNVPVDNIGGISKYVKSKETPVLLYCQSGARAASACSRLRGMGYSDVSNVGGFSRAGKLF